MTAVEPRRLDPRQPQQSTRPGTAMPIWLKCLLIAAILCLYVGIAAILVYFVSRSGAYPSGSDTMFYLHRGNFLYHSIVDEGNWYPLIDLSWYNGVQTWRYWSPVSAFILAGCQALAGGNVFDGYLLMVGAFYVLGAVIWLAIGCTHDRPWMGAFLGALWFFVPMNLFMFFAEGVLVRSMAMPFLPWFLVSVHDYLYRPTAKRWAALPHILLSFTLIILLHIGWAGMLAIALLIYLVFYFIVHLKKEERVGLTPMLLCILLAFLITGVWTYPSLQGGITGIDTSSIMRSYFQPLRMTVDPFYGATSVYDWNRWDHIAAYPYFGFVAFLLSGFGMLFSHRRTVPGFATALTLCLLTTTAAYPILVLLPGSSYLWMLRFISIALTFLLVSFFFWSTLKKRFQLPICVLLVAEAALAFGLFVGTGSGATPEERFLDQSREPLIQAAKAITTQRCSIVEPGSSVGNGVYMLSGFGEDAVPTSYGQGVQSAVNYTNVVQINQAAEDGQYLYMFDRLLEMGNDSVIVPVYALDPQYADVELLDAAAARVGYALAEHNENFRLYHIDAPDAFGLVSHYRAIAIGTGSNAIALGFPAVEETSNIYLDEYTFDQLKDYEVIYLAGFMYHDLATAEALVRDLSEHGVRILIMADGIPSDEHTGSKSFLGVTCNTVTFQNGYPALETIDGVLYCDLFPQGHTDWRTVYLNGLTDVWGSIRDIPDHPMDFYGTGENENIIYIGLALTYHYSLTLDPSVGMLLSHALDIPATELPQRTIFPMTLDYGHNTLTVTSPVDGLNTTLGYHDIFRSDRPLSMVNNMTVVDKGTTTIHLVYPYLGLSLGITVLGLVLSLAYLPLMRRRLDHLAQKEARRTAETAPAETPPQPETPA